MAPFPPNRRPTVKRTMTLSGRRPRRASGRLQKNLRFVSVIVRPGTHPAVLATVQAAWAVPTVTVAGPPDGASAAEAVRMAVRSRRRLRGGMVLDEPGERKRPEASRGRRRPLG